jgi:hypothetical protein
MKNKPVPLARHRMGRQTSSVEGHHLKQRHGRSQQPIAARVPDDAIVACAQGTTCAAGIMRDFLRAGGMTDHEIERHILRYVLSGGSA